MAWIKNFLLFQCATADTSSKFNKMKPSIQDNSDDSDGPISRGARRLAVAYAQQNQIAILDGATSAISNIVADPVTLAPPSNHPIIPATARIQKPRRVLMNGIAKFPVWMEVTDPIDPLSDGTSKRRIVFDDGTAECLGIDHTKTGSGIIHSSKTDNDTRPFNYSGMPELISDSDDSVDSFDLLNNDGVSSDTGASDSCAVSGNATKYVLRRAKPSSDVRSDVPPLNEQDPYKEAAHGSTSSSGLTGSSDGSLSDDFIDKNEPIVTHVQAKTLMRFFPIMCQDMIKNGI